MPPTVTRRRFLSSTAAVATAGWLQNVQAQPVETLPNTEPLTDKADLATKMVDAIHAYLNTAIKNRRRFHPEVWKSNASLEPNRLRFKKYIGVVDDRRKPELEYIATGPTGPNAIAKGDGYSAFAVRWAVFDGVDGEGLLLQPEGKPVARIVALPDADWSPEMLVGVAPGILSALHFARRLAENGSQVLIPTLIDRQDTWSANPKINRATNFPHREFIYRMAYEMGRHIIGYEVQKVLAAVDWFTEQNVKEKCPIGVFGYGEGGLLAFYSAAIDERIEAAGVSGYFGPRDKVDEEPIYRNVWGLLHEFGDAEIAALVKPRRLVIETTLVPNVSGPPAPRQGRGGAAPGKLVSKSIGEVERELMALPPQIGPKVDQRTNWLVHVTSQVQPGSDAALSQFLKALAGQEKLKPAGQPPKDTRTNFDPNIRLKRQFNQLVEFTQSLVRQSDAKRQALVWSKLSNPDAAARDKSHEELRKYFHEVIGQLPPTARTDSARSRLIHDEPKWRGYEIVLQSVFTGDPDFSYGILAVPKGLKEGERRPVVVCQHGLEGRPQVVINPKEKTKYYNSFGNTLADRGFVVFAPQNPYIGQNHFRQIQRKANPLKLSLFSFIVRQHERILDWLATQPFVDPKRMAFYGLSYGGKTAMRVPAILDKYCLSICSADFNEWIWKNTSVSFPGSYMFTVEYDMCEFDLGNTFNYAEMAMLIAPRPFMVERGHDDGVGIDEWVALEFAKVRRHYTKLGIPDRTAIEFFNGGHEINLKGTLAFLEKHLKWPE